jgi:tRNA-modifying protein YgfZ
MRPPPRRYNEIALKQDNSSGYAALRHGAALVERPAGRILLTGADRRAYLQGLLTNDIEALTPGTGCYAAMLTAQGRMMTDARVLELGDGILLDVPPAVTAAIRDHLDRFIFAEDVVVQDVTAERAELGVYGPRAADVLRQAVTTGALPGDLYASTRAEIAGADVILVRSDDPGIAGYDVIVSAGSAPAVQRALRQAGAVPASEIETDVVRVESGRPKFGADMDTETIPLEAGIEDRALSRTKGCYVGQEVIVRVLDRGGGRVARRLAGFALSPASPLPASGTRVHASGKDVGWITSAVSSPARGPIALGYVHRDFTPPGTSVTIDGSGDALVAALPFVPLE